MFTFGLFTTHIPYVAFVVFYAYFLLFGVEKASKGEIDFGNHHFKTELQVNHINPEIQSGSNFYLQFENNALTHINFEKFFFKRKIKHPCFCLKKHIQWEYFSTIFNRPPPVLS